MGDYIHELENRIELMLDQNQSLEMEKDQAINLLNRKKEYIKNVIDYLAYKLQEADRGAAWEALGVISKMDEKVPYYEKTKEAELVSSYVCKRLDF
jgi:hypothetical protein